MNTDSVRFWQAIVDSAGAAEILAKRRREVFHGQLLKQIVAEHAE